MMQHALPLIFIKSVYRPVFIDSTNVFISNGNKGHRCPVNVLIGAVSGKDWLHKRSVSYWQECQPARKTSISIHECSAS